MSDTNDQPMKLIAAALAAPFDPREVKWKPQMAKNNRALATAYIDARLIQDRLDDVLGVGNWSDAYELLPDGSVMCTLRLFLAGRWVRKVDVGSTSEQPDSGDRMKAAFSDALKRAAVKFGIGRYLYRLPAQWVDYDPVKKQITQLPQMPAFAIPGGKAQPPKQSPRHPNPEPAPDKPDPLTDRAELDRLLAQKGKAFATALLWLGKETGEVYDPRVVVWTQIPEQDRLTLVKAVRGMPDAAPEQKASA